MNTRDQRTLFDLTQDGLVIGKKIQRIYPEFDVSAFVADVRTEMEGRTLYNVTNAIGRVLRQHLPEDYSDALAILMDYVNVEAPSEPARNPTAEVETSLRPISYFVSLYGFGVGRNPLNPPYQVDFKGFGVGSNPLNPPYQGDFKT